ncbi:nuclear transport factor 2 family protein [Haloplanus halobius]|uniref:nuclear transport factor 2 family protein n=1 Tax=Haloplanus halobius TaxID=2934938 RepID=UPI00200F7CCB|nr:nuclear transport factor 2 family protein [Haloplanus sp. XH21]
MNESDAEDAEATVRAFYAAIDDGAYDRLRELLAPEFVHHRPDRTLDGRERFVRFMREERPRTDTEHVVEAVAVAADRETVFVRGLLRAADGETLFGFVDVHRVGTAGIEALSTYTK